MKVISIPRLELCAALLLSKLMKYVESVYRARGKVERIYACSDSQIALSWISSSPHRWQTFVANRVSLIQTNISRGYWFFVQGRENVADIISRGMYPREFIENKYVRLSGPKWLKGDIKKWPLVGIKNLELPNA